MMMKVCIHRGAHQIGGTCVELACQGKKLVLDIGVPLDADDPAKVAMPPVAGLTATDPSLLGIVISHPHQDHYGLAARVPEGTTFLMGAATERILAAAADFTPSGGTFENVLHLSDRQPIELGPFRITPYLMDHSAYDAYAVLIEAGGKRLFYTGDLRGHGRKAKLFERLLAAPPTNMDVLLMEGT
ncbi:MAG: MBL fold metallo-hydrolase, partial [Kiritimatiellia bacterium]|nr:MBL fold metallo-hydrolase [Kiritimatiellia bacterium]